MLFLLSYEVHIMFYKSHLNTYTHKYIFSENVFFLMETRLRVESSSFYIEKLAQTSRAENSNRHCHWVKVH